MKSILRLNFWHNFCSKKKQLIYCDKHRIGDVHFFILNENYIDILSKRPENVEGI